MENFKLVPFDIDEISLCDWEFNMEFGENYKFIDKDSTSFKFKNSGIKYNIYFRNLIETDINTEILQKTTKNNGFYSLSFGVLNEDNNEIYFKQTNLNNPISVLVNVMNITRKFLLTDEVNILTFKCNNKLKNISKHIYNLHLNTDYDFIEFEVENNYYEVFLIKK